MQEIRKQLFVGDQRDGEELLVTMPVGNVEVDPVKAGWAVVHACKEPFHRNELGYTSRGAPKTHPDYLFAVRGNRMILNLVDTEDPAFVNPVLVDRALEYIHGKIAEGKKVLVHCNQGRSRSPSLAMMYLHKYDDIYRGLSFEDAEHAMREAYPDYAPARGMREFAEENWANI